jgi:hypothetical protein
VLEAAGGIVSTTETIARGDLIDIVDAATYGLTASTRAKLLAVAQTTEAVAVGWFHCNGVTCPARQARRRNQDFQTAFDRRMAARFGREWDDEAIPSPFEPFVVRVVADNARDKAAC